MEMLGSKKKNWKFLEHEVSKLCWDGVAIIFGGRVANFFLTCDRR